MQYAWSICKKLFRSFVYFVVSKWVLFNDILVKKQSYSFTIFQLERKRYHHHNRCSRDCQYGLTRIRLFCIPWTRINFNDAAITILSKHQFAITHIWMQSHTKFKCLKQFEGHAKKCFIFILSWLFNNFVICISMFVNFRHY